jgi:predicted nuclease with TOPRIM domain
VTTSNYLIKENPSIKFQIVCVPTDKNITEPNEIKKVYNSIDYKKIGQKINIEGKYKDNTPSIVSSFNEQKKSINSYITSQSNEDFDSLNNKVTDLKKKIQEMEEKIKQSTEKLQELYSKSVGLKEENNEKNENEKNNTSTLNKLIKNKYSEIFTLIAVLCSFILGASINRLK